MKLRIKEHRKARRWTIDQLAEVSGLSRGYVSQLENEKRQPSAETLHILATTFGISVLDIIDDGAEKDDLTRIVEVMKLLSPEDRKAALRVAQGFLSQSLKVNPE